MTSTVLSESKPDVYSAITAKIVAAIEAGAGTCTMPSHGSIVPPAFPVNAATQKPYRGGNILALWVEAYVRRYISGYWASYRQWKRLGGQVRKGERGAVIVFYKLLDQPDREDTNDDDNSRQRFVARASYVFNSEQVDHWQPPEPTVKSQVQINAEVAAFVKAIGADIRHGSSVARYRHDLDCIEMPNPEDFIGTSTSSPLESYHAVLFHELVHLSGAPHRLNREFGKRFGDRAYAFEEIVGELGAAFLCSAFRIANEPRDDHAAYVSSWLTILNRDTRAIFTAASKAQEACEYLLQLAATKPAR
ncbi:MAG: DUF1738 domain-containing protein [Alphaproteobacteria bacterium]|nr:DUF1738 domain-containing protein [Alphaproteobacteria bacterium]